MIPLTKLPNETDEAQERRINFGRSCAKVGVFFGMILGLMLAMTVVQIVMLFK